MSYRLGIDLGTTYTSAAVYVSGWPTMVGLGNRAMQVPSVLFLKPDGEFLVGETAERRGAVETARLTREFKRRLGDQVPVLVAGSPHSPQALQARLLSWVVDRVTQRQGSAPDHITLTYPANWGPYKRDLFDQTIAMADLAGTHTCTEPEAAATLYAARNVMAEGDCVAVYDLGGGTFDAAVLRRTPTGFDLLGRPEGIEHLGGIDFDEAVFHHVLESLGEAVAALPQGPDMEAGLTRLRRDCVDAKEALSADTDAVIPVGLPGLSTSVRLVRDEFETMIRPAIADTLAALQRAVRSVDIQTADLSAIVLTGGSSRIPLVSQQITQAFNRPLALDTHPKHDVALGAAIHGSQLPTSATQAHESTAVPAAGNVASPQLTRTDPGPSNLLPHDGSTEESKPAARLRLLAVLSVALVLVVLVVVVAVLRQSGSQPSGTPGTTSTTSPSVPAGSLQLESPGPQSSTIGFPVDPVSLVIHGGTPPREWSATGLPRGLKISGSTGVISGKPLVPGTSEVTVTVSDGTQRDTVSFSWRVVHGEHCTNEVLGNGDFERRPHDRSWRVSQAEIQHTSSTPSQAHAGAGFVSLPGTRDGSAIRQTIRVPDACSAELVYFLRGFSTTSSSPPHAVLTVKANGLQQIHRIATLRRPFEYVEASLDLTKFAGRTVSITVSCSGGGPTSGFLIDDIAIILQRRPGATPPPPPTTTPRTNPPPTTRPPTSDPPTTRPPSTTPPPTTTPPTTPNTTTPPTTTGPPTPTQTTT